MLSTITPPLGPLTEKVTGVPSATGFPSEPVTEAVRTSGRSARAIGGEVVRVTDATDTTAPAGGASPRHTTETAVPTNAPTLAPRPVFAIREPYTSVDDHVDYGLVEMHGAGGAEEAGVAEGKHPAVARHEPVPLPRRRRRHPDDRRVQPQVPGRAEEPGVAEGKHPAVGRHEPVPVPRRRGRHAHYGRVQPQAPGRAEEAGVTEGEHPAVGRHEPVPRARVVAVGPTGRAGPVAVRDRDGNDGVDRRGGGHGGDSSGGQDGHGRARHGAEGDRRIGPEV